MIDTTFLNLVLRSPSDVAARCRDERDVTALARTALFTLAISSIAFGAAVGSWRGGRQIAFAALKMPIGILGSLVICTVLYIAVSLVLTGIVKYDQLNVPDPIAVGINAAGQTAIIDSTTAAATAAS